MAKQHKAKGKQDIIEKGQQHKRTLSNYLNRAYIIPQEGRKKETENIP